MRFALLLSVCGLAGIWARYGVGVLALRLLGSQMLWGTLAVNILGCFAVGWLLGSGHFLRDVRLALSVGLLGGFTTFSTFGYETLTLLQSGNWRIAALYVGGSLVLGVGAVWLGLQVAR